MRVPTKTIREEGERLSPHSKFYIWGEWLFEPSLYRGKPTKSYKPVTDKYRIARALERNDSKAIPTVESIRPSFHSHNKSTFKHDRFAILDL